MNTPTFDLDPAHGMPPGRTLEALYGVAYTFLDAERISEATKAFRVMVRFAPTDERAWLGLGACHERLDEDDVAAELYGAGSVVASPPSPRCLLALARVERRRGNDGDADEFVGEAMALAESLDDHELIELVAAEARGT